jgi:hypothetical protein
MVPAELASTHLLKPEPVNALLAGMTTNERFCMGLAASIGIEVASTQLVHVPEPVLVVERFDRVRVPEGIGRLHCIDGCQALGLPVALKHERPYGNGEHVRHIREGANLPVHRRLLSALQRSLDRRGTAGLSGKRSAEPADHGHLAFIQSSSRSPSTWANSLVL